jgi:uncharacterized DUF497 family protein
MRITIKQLIWDEWNVGHIKKHCLSVKEIESAINYRVAQKKGYQGRIIIIGRSGKRLISVILAKEEKQKYYVVTARDADKKEKQLVYEKEK